MALTDGARADLVAVLQRSGAFREVRSVQGFEPGVDLILVSSLEELVGARFEEFELSLLRVGFVRFRREPARGIARIRVRLEDREHTRFEDVIEVRHEASRGDRARAALDALALAHERLADTLHGRLVPARSLRRVPVRLLDGCGLGPKAALRVLDDASEIFEREADVRFVGRAETWTAPRHAVAQDEVLQVVRALAPPAGGIVLALFSADRIPAFSLVTEPAGTAVQLGEHALVRCGKAGEVQTSTVAHELGHLFGGVHTRERASVMHDVAEFDGRFFDLLNREIIRTGRARPFGRALPESVAARLRELYASADQQPKLYSPSTVAVARSAVESGGR